MRHAGTLSFDLAGSTHPGLPRTFGSARSLVVSLAGALLLACIALALSPSPGELGLSNALHDLRGSLDVVDPAASPVEPPIAAAREDTPSYPIRSGLRLVHVIGLVAGMGAALILDLFLVSRLYWRPIDRHTAELLRFGSRIVAVGLALLWMSGIGFLIYYAVWTPEALDNPKLVAKVSAVFILTVNGLVLHRIVLPLVDQRIGKPLLAGLPLRAAILPLSAGAISGSGWAFCCMLGIVRELNGVGPPWLLVAAYLLVALLAIVCAAGLHLAIEKADAAASGKSALSAIRC